MAIQVAAALIIGAIISAAGGVAGGIFTSQDVEAAQNEARRLANMKRDDELKWKNTQERLSKSKLRLEQKRLGFQREAELFGRKERGLERGMLAREKSVANTMGLINSNQAMRGNFLNFFQRGSAGRRVA